MRAKYALGLEAVIEFNAQINGPHCMLDRGKLEAALARPLQEVFGHVPFRTPHQKAAALMESLALAHCFVDANKRTAWWASVTFLGNLGFQLDAPAEEAGQIVIDVVEHKIDIDGVALWLLEHTV